MSGREFRTRESYEAERITRDMLLEFLRERGFRDVQDSRRALGVGKTETQTIYATSPDGESLVMRVRLCWRRTGGGSRESTYSAAQLQARVKNYDWEGALKALAKRVLARGVTHFLIVQRENDQITSAALLPLSELWPIWCAQRDISKSLIAQGKLGRRKKNHAENGSSPTLWLKDDRAPEVAAALWDHAGVRDLATLQIVGRTSKEAESVDDTFDDIPSIDYSHLGTDAAPAIPHTRSYVKRDRRVRRAVLQRANGKCEHEDCGAARSYPGFLDVHHVLGAQKSDRAWNCVALCPNCHREAHVAPNRDQMNATLLRLAERFKPLT